MLGPQSNFELLAEVLVISAWSERIGGYNDQCYGQNHWGKPVWMTCFLTRGNSPLKHNTLTQCCLKGLRYLSLYLVSCLEREFTSICTWIYLFSRLTLTFFSLAGYLKEEEGPWGWRNQTITSPLSSKTCIANTSNPPLFFVQACNKSMNFMEF